jgi:NADPH2:quinone reductase
VQASVLRAFGPPSVLRLEEVEDPQPGPGKVLLDVHLANVTFVETQIRAGKAPRVEMLPKLPVILETASAEPSWPRRTRTKAWSAAG